MYASDRTPTLDEFLDACDRECDFLIRDYGFTRLAEPREYNEYSVRFRKGDLEVSIFGESWGKTASCELLRGKDELYLGFLVPAAERKGMPPGQLAQVKAIADRLKQYASDFLNGDMTRFDTALAEWKRITADRPVTEAHRHERELATAVTLAGHASKRGDHAEVVRLLGPHENELSQHQKRMLDESRDNLNQKGD